MAREDETPDKQEQPEVEDQDQQKKDKTSQGAPGEKKTLGKTAAGAVIGSSETGRKVQETAQKVNQARRLGQSALSGIKGAVSVLLNPYFWIVVGAIALILLIVASFISGSNVIGRNENADGCIPTDDGGSGVTVTPGANATENYNAIASWLMSAEFEILGGESMSMEQAAGVIGNFGQESGGDPAITQSGWGDASMSNAQMMQVSGGGKAIGLAQWDGGRRTNLARFAQQNGGHWSDMQMQLEFLREEINAPYEAGLLRQHGFHNEGESVNHYVKAFEQGFERAGKPHYEGRYAAAAAFLENFNGGYTSDTGGSCVTALGSGEFSGEIAELALQLSYPLDEKDRSYTARNGDGPAGRQVATPEYKEAKAQAESATGVEPLGLFASCDVFVATVLRNTVDQDVPWTSTLNQIEYFESSPKWQEYTDPNQVEPGDVWIHGKGRNGYAYGHVVIHTGEINGRKTIAHASSGSRVAAVDYLDYIYDGMTDISLGRPHTGFRFVG